MDAGQVAYTSEWHLGHKNILHLGRGRPFDSIEEHDETIIENCNKTIPKGRLYFLGDMTNGKTSRLVEILKRVKAQVYFVGGNHDPEPLPLEVRELVAWSGLLKHLTIDEQKIVMCHYPLLTWKDAHKGAWMLHGHSHNNLKPTTQPRLDIGVDGHDFKPWLHEEVVELMKTRSYTAVDHHGKPAPLTEEQRKSQALDIAMFELAKAIPGEVNAAELLGKISTELYGSE